MRGARSISSFVAATVFAATSALGQGMDLGPPLDDPAREWTVLVYLDADNDLEQFALIDLNEMEAGLPEQGVEVIVLVDRAEGYDDSDGDWQDARVYRVRKDNDPNRIGSELLGSIGEANMGNPSLISAFVAGALRRYPARRTAMVFWDHGGGWQAMAIDHNAPGSAEGHDGLDLPEVSAGLRAGLGALGLSKLDIIGFDMCLMAQVETAYEMKDLARVMVASQAVEPGDGWPYHEILPAFGAGTMGPRRVAASIVEGYGRFYDARQEVIATQSAVDLSVIGEVAGSLNAIAAGTSGSLAQTWSDISRSMFFSESYADRRDVRRDSQVLASVDLLDMLKRVRASAEAFPAENAYRDLVDAMDRAVIANYRTAKHRLSNGVAIYAPVVGEQYNAEYGKTAFARDTAWPQLLSDLHRTQQANLTAPRVTSVQAVDSPFRPRSKARTCSGSNPCMPFSTRPTTATACWRKATSSTRSISRSRERRQPMSSTW